MKKILAIILGAIISCTITASAVSIQQMRFHCDKDTTEINNLLFEGYNSGLKTPNELVVFYAHKLLGCPYVAHTLEGETEKLTINIDQLDCTTFVETLYALTRSTLNGRLSWRDYAYNLEDLRYRNGKMGDYSSRLHYISEWIVNNRSRGNLVEVTSEIPTSDYLIKTINFMTTHKDSYTSLKDNDEMVRKIRNFEMGYRHHRMPYVKKQWLSRKGVKDAFKSGDFVGLVTKVEGLDISHLGIIYKDENGENYLLDASMSGGKVQIEKENLFDMLRHSKNNLGLRVFRIMP